VPLRDVLAQVSAYDVLLFRYGYRPAEPSLLALLASMFLHGGFLHLFGNMLFLWIYGDNVEHRLGRAGYLVSYLACGAAATLAHAAFDPGSRVPMVGASGAISGTLGFYFLFFPRNQVRLFVALFPFLVDVVTVPARLVLGAYLVIDNLLPFLASRAPGSGGVAHGAHIGGFVAGLGLAWLVDRRERLRIPPGFRAPRPARGEPTARPVDPAEAVARLVRDGRFAEAASVYFRGDAAVDRALAPFDALELGRWLAADGHPRAALSIFRRVLARRPGREVAAEAHAAAGEVLLAALGRPTSAFQHFLDAIDLAPDSAAADVSRHGLAVIEALRPRRGAR
jgi:membrane associated rhomboid family serine protease